MFCQCRFDRQGRGAETDFVQEMGGQNGCAVTTTFLNDIPDVSAG